MPLKNSPSYNTLRSPSRQKCMAPLRASTEQIAFSVLVYSPCPRQPISTRQPMSLTAQTLRVDRSRRPFHFGSCFSSARLSVPHFRSGQRRDNPETSPSRDGSTQSQHPEPAPSSAAQCVDAPKPTTQWTDWSRKPRPEQTPICKPDEISWRGCGSHTSQTSQTSHASHTSQTTPVEPYNPGKPDAPRKQGKQGK